MPIKNKSIPIVLLAWILVVSTFAPALEVAARADFPTPAQPLAYTTSHSITGPAGIEIDTHSGSIAFSRSLLIVPTTESLIPVAINYASDEAGDARLPGGWSFSLSYSYERTVDGVLQVTLPDGSLRLYWRGDEIDDRHYVEYAPGRYRIEDLRGLTVEFGGEDSRHASRIITPEGLAVELSYQGDYLTTITAPDLIEGTVTLTYDVSGHLTGITDFDGGVWTYDYDADNRIININDADNDTFTLTYDFWQLTGIHGSRDGLQIVYDELTRTLTYSLDGVEFTATHIYNTQGQLREAQNHQDEHLFYEWDDLGRLRSYHTGDGTGETYTYDAAGNIIRVVNSRGEITRYTYSEQGNLMVVEDELGNLTRYSYDDEGNVTYIRDPLGNETRLTYDDDGNLLAWTDPLGNTTTYTYDTDGNKISETDALGNTTTFTYDLYGNVLTRTGPDGAVTQYAYDALGRQISETDPMGGEMTFAYDASGNLVSETGHLGDMTVYAYDAYGNLATETDAIGNQIVYEYDDFGRLITETTGDTLLTAYTYDPYGSLLSETDGEGHTTTYTYAYLPQPVIVTETDANGSLTVNSHDANGNVMKTTDAAGHVTLYTYDAKDRLIETVDALGGTITQTYDANDNILSITDKRGGTTTYEYDALDRVIRTTGPDGLSVITEYDALGRVVAVVDPAGNRSEMVYDVAGNLVSTIMGDAVETYTYDLNHNLLGVTDALDHTTTYTYDANNNRLSETDALGHTTTFVYDALGNQISVIDALGNTTTREYDIFGNVIAETDALGNTTRYTYDLRGLLLETTYPSGATMISEYDGTGNVIRYTNADGDVTTMQYDPRGLLVEMTDPAGFSTNYRYNELGYMVAMTDGAGHTNTYTLDAAGNILAQTDPLGQTTAYTLDAMGRVIEQIDPAGGVTTMQYDASGNLTASTDPAGNTVTFSYDAYGNVLTATDALGATTTYTYDANDNLLSETDALGGVTTYTYDANGNLLSETDVLGSVTRYEYDATGNRTAVIDATGERFEVTYDASGNVLTETDALGNVTTYEYDVDGNRTRVIDPMGDAIAYTYTSGGNLASSTDAAGNVTRYEYDARDNLTALIDPNGHVTRYAYDGRSNLLTEARPDGGTIVYEYDAAGQLISTTDAIGNTTVFTYDVLGNRVTMTDALGNTTHYEYDAVGNQTGITNPLGATTEHTYDAVGNRIATTDPLGGVTTFSYDMLGRLVEQVAADGRILAYTYDASGNLTQKVDFDGGVWAFEYDALGRQIAVIDPDGEHRNLVYDVVGNVTRETNAAGVATDYTYDGRGNIDSMTMPNGATTAYTSDQAGNVTQIVDALGGITTFVYDGAGNLLRETNANGDTITYAYDTMNRRIARTDAVGNTTTYAYDLNGNLLSETDALGSVTAHEYDALGQRTATIDANGHAIHFSYDAAGNRINRTDVAGYTTTYTYDAVGRQIGETNALGATTTFAYDSTGNLVTVTDALGATTTYTYDIFGNRASETDALGNTTTYAYDRYGNLLSKTNALGDTTTYTYDAAGNRISMTDPDGDMTRYQYDSSGNLISERDPAGGVMRYEYDANSRLVRVITPSGGETVHAYDAVGNRIRTTDALGNTTTYTYDARGFRITETTPDGATTAYTYDAGGNLAAMTTPDGATTAHRYDAAGNRVETTYADGSTATFAYDRRGNRFYDQNDAVRVLRLYDAVGNLVFTNITTDAFSQTMRYVYDTVGNRTAQHISGGGTFDYAYDAAGNLIAITNPDEETTTFTYDAVGQLVEQGYANGTQAVFAYLPDGEMASYTHTAADSTVIAAAEYTYDERGLRESVTDASGTTTYAYDTVGQLVEAVYSDGTTEQFAYDAAGNRASMTADGETTVYTYDAAGRLAAAGDATFTFDVNGQRLAEETEAAVVNYGYDAAGNLIAVESAAVQQAYTYYPNGDRLSQRYQNDDTRYTIYDPHTDNALLDFDADGEVIAVYTGGASIDRMVSVSHASGLIQTYHQDAQKSVVAMSDGDGEAAAHFSYSAFGEIRDMDGVFSSRFTYTGREIVAGADLYYYRARFYDAATGLFNAPDPLPESIRRPSTFNTYVYTANNPTSFTDPYGTDIFSDAADAVSGVVSEAFDAVTDALGDAWEGATMISDNVYQLGDMVAMVVGDDIMEMALATYNAVYVASQSYGNFMYGAHMSMLNAVAKLGEAAVAAAQGDWDDALSSAMSISDDLMDVGMLALEQGGNALGAALPALNMVTSQMGGVIEAALGPIVDGLGMAIDFAFDALHFLIDPLMEQIIGPLIRATVKPAVKELLLPMADFALDPVDDELDKIEAAQEEVLGPLKERIEEGGENLDAMYTDEIVPILEDTLGPIRDAMADVGELAAEVADNSSANILESTFAPIVDGIIKPFYDRLDNLVETITDPFLEAIDPLMNRVTSTLDRIAGVMAPLQEYIMGPLSEEREDLVDQMREDWLEPIFRPIIQLHREIPGFGEFFMMVEEDMCGNAVREDADGKKDAINDLIKGDMGMRTTGGIWTTNVVQIVEGLRSNNRQCKRAAMKAAFCLASELAGPFEKDDAEGSDPDLDIDLGLQRLNNGAAITDVTGPQIVEVRENLDGTIRVRVVNDEGRPYAEANIVFSAPLGGASGTFAETGRPHQRVLTDAEGYATASQFAANSFAGEYTINIELDAQILVGSFGNIPLYEHARDLGIVASIDMENQPDDPILYNIGSEEYVGIVNQAPIEGGSIRVAVMDQWGNPYPGTAVTFTAPEGDVASLNMNGARTTVVETDEMGIIDLSDLRLSTVAGSYEVRAQVLNPSQETEDDLTETFNFTNNPDDPDELIVDTTSSRTARVYHAFGGMPVQVVDQFGNPTPEHQVTLQVPFDGPSAVIDGVDYHIKTFITDADGRINPPLVANAIPGSYELIISMTRWGLRESISLQNLHGIPARVDAAGGDGQKTGVLTAFSVPLSVNVYDNAGRPLYDIPVVFNAPGSGATLIFGAEGGNQTEIETNLQGHAASPRLVASSVAGVYSVTATAGDITAQFTLENALGLMNYLTFSPADRQFATVGEVFQTPLNVCVTDVGGNTTAGLPVKFVAAPSGPHNDRASGVFAPMGSEHGGLSFTALTNDAGCASASAFTANTVSGVYSITVNVNGSTIVFNMENLPDVPHHLGAEGGTTRMMTVSNAYDLPLDIVVYDVHGNVVPDADVMFTITAGVGGASGFLSDDNDADGIITTTSNARGYTGPYVTANDIAGDFDVRAEVLDTAGNVDTNVAPIDFTLTNLAGDIAELRVVNGDGQSGTVNRAFGASLDVLALDAFGNPAPDEDILFAAGAGDTSARFGLPLPLGTTTTTITTGADGIASSGALFATTRTGTHSVTAMTDNGLSVTFTLENTPGQARMIAIDTVNSGPTSAPIAGTPGPVVVHVTDRYGNTVVDDDVTFSITGAGATFSNDGSTITIGAASGGTYSSGDLKATNVAGPYSVTISATGAPSQVLYLETTPGDLAALTPVQGDGQQARVNTMFSQSFSVRAIDAHGNPVPGVAVSFTAPGTGASGIFASAAPVTTDANGIATSANFTANDTGSPSSASPYAVTATSGAISVDFSLLNTVAPALVIISGDGQITPANTAFDAPLVVQLQDEFGQGVDGIAVTVNAPHATFNGSAAQTVTTSGGGYASSAVPVASADTGSYYVHVSTSYGGAAGVDLQLTNDGSLSLVAIPAANSMNATVNAAYADINFCLEDALTGNRVEEIISVALSVPTDNIAATGVFTDGRTHYTTTTASDGCATVSGLTANPVAGTFDLTLAVAGNASTIAMTNTAGSAAMIHVSGTYTNEATVSGDFGPLTVEVTDADGNAVDGETVTFTVLPAVSGATATLGSTTADTIGGIASINATANTLTGTYTVRASIDAGAQTTFTLTNTAGTATSMTLNGGDGQSNAPNTPFVMPLSVRVADNDDNGVPGVLVDFGGQPATTNVAGIATVYYTAPATTGDFTVTATSPGLTDVTFNLTVLPGAVTNLNFAPIGAFDLEETQTDAITLTVEDGAGNPVPGTSVVLSVPSSVGSFGGASQITLTADASGIVTVPTFSAKRLSGNFIVTATSGDAMGFGALSVNSGAPDSIAIVMGGSQTTTVNNPFGLPMRVLVTDQHGNPVIGETVAFTAPGGGPSATLLPVSVVTDGNGYANIDANTVHANTRAGYYSVTAEINGLQAMFNLTNRPGAPHSIVLVEGGGESAPIETRFGTSLRVQVTDTYGNLVWTPANVEFSAASGLDFSAPNVATINGESTTGVIALTDVGTYNVTVSVAGISDLVVNGFAVTPGAPATITTTHVDQTTHAGEAFTGFGVTVVDTAGNAVPNVAVTFSAGETTLGASAWLNGTGNRTFTVTTNPSGVATVAMTANSIADPDNSYPLTATVIGTGLSTSINLTNTYTATVDINVVSPGGMQVRRGYAINLTVTVTDVLGNPFRGQEVSATITDNSTGNERSFQLNTDADGVVVFNAANTSTAFATIPADYSATTFEVQLTANENHRTNTYTVLPGDPHTVNVYNGNDQSTTYQAFFHRPVEVRVTDGAGFAIPGQTVTIRRISNEESCGIRIYNVNGNQSGGTTVTDVNGETPKIRIRSDDGPDCTGSLEVIAGSITERVTGLEVRGAGLVRITGGLENIQETPAGSRLAGFTITSHLEITNETHLDGSRVIEPVVAVIRVTLDGEYAYFFDDPTTTELTFKTNEDGCNDPITCESWSWANRPNYGSSTRLEIGGGSPIYITTTGKVGNWVLRYECVLYWWDGSSTTCDNSMNQGISTVLPDTVDTITWNNVPTETQVGTQVSNPGQLCFENNGVAAQPEQVTITTTGGVDQPAFVWEDNSNYVTFYPTYANNTSGCVTNMPVWSANTIAGDFPVLVQTSGGGMWTGTFTNRPGAVASLELVSGGESVAVNATVGTEMKVRALDAHGNPVAGQTIVFTAPNSGPGFEGGNTRTRTTDANGEASTQPLVNGIAGRYTVTVAGNTGNVVTIDMENVPVSGENYTAAILSGNNQTALAGEAYAQPLRVRVTYNGNPVSNPSAPVEFIADGVTIDATSVTVGPDGYAQVNATAGNTPGTGKVEIWMNGEKIGQFNFDIEPNIPANMTLASGDNQTRAIGAAFNPLCVQVLDAYDNPATHANVLFDGVPANSGEPGTGSAVVNVADNGLACYAPTANNVIGSYTVTASTTGLPDVTFHLTNTAGAAAAITLTQGDGQSATVTDTFTDDLVFSVIDDYGNPVVNGTTVTFSVAGAGLTGVPASATTTGGEITLTVTAGSLAGDSTITVTAGSVSTTVTLTATSGTAAQIAVNSGSGQTITVNTAALEPLCVLVSDVHGNPVGGVGVTFAQSGMGADISAGLSATSASSGIACVTPTANETAGSYQVMASVSGLPDAAFDLTNAPGAPASMTITRGQGQTVPVGEAFGLPLCVKVFDGDGNTVNGVDVTFTAPAATDSAGTSSAVMLDPTSGEGVACVTPTANGTLGAYDIIATSGTLPAQTFNITNTVGTAAQLTYHSGNQALPIGATVDSLCVTLTDAYGHAIEGEVVTFTAPSSGPGFNGATTRTDATNTSGVACVIPAVNDQAGTYTVTASYGSLTATINLENLPGDPAVLTPSGDGQSARLGEAFATPLSVTVVDSGSNPVPNASVTFDAGGHGVFAGSGTSTQTVITDASGVAVTTALTAQGSLGTFAVSATTGTASTSFSLTTTAGQPAAIATSGGGQSAPINTAFGAPLSVTITDAGGNPVAGVTVTFAAPGGGPGGTPAQGSVVTNASGVASTGFTANNLIGSYTVTVTTGALSAAIGLENTVGAPANISITGGNGQTAFTDAAFGTPLTVRVTDAGGNPVAGVTVTFTAPGSGPGGTLTQGSVTTDADGVAATGITANNETGSFNVTVSVSSLTATFTMHIEAP